MKSISRGHPLNGSSRPLEDGTPAYVRIQAELRRRIQDGHYTEGEPLPSQRQLSEEFGVTVMTLRQAIEILRRERLVVTRQGLGTFVTARRFSYAIGPLRGLTQEIEDQGGQLTTEVLRWREVIPVAAIASALGIGEREQTVCVERLRRVDGEPIVYQRSHLPLSVGRSLERSQLSSGSLYEVMAARLGFEVDHARERLSPAVLTGRIARLLECRAGSPGMLSERVSLTTSGRPVLHDKAFMSGERLVITADRRRSDVSIRYELVRAAGGDTGATGSHRPKRRRR